MKFKHLLKSITLTTAIVTPVTILTSCNQKPGTTDEKVTKITINGDSGVSVGKSITLTASVEPTTAKDKSVTWSVSDSSKATITSSGVLTGKAKGSVTVTATANDGSGVKGTKSINVDDGTVITETWTDYIFNRTFSLLGMSHVSGYEYNVSWGTCWILSDATPNITTDYVYNIVTNWHVIKGIEDSQTTENYILFGCNTKSVGLDINNNDYIPFTSFELKDDSNFTYNNSDTITSSEYDEQQGKVVAKTGKKGCDIHVAKADFSSMLSVIDQSPSAPIAKKKLDKLNQITQTGAKITTLANTTTDSSHFENKKLYTAGYPVKNTDYATWETHNLSQENITLQYDAGTQGKTTAADSAHWADNHNSPLIDCSPQYISETDVGTSWMMGGASGSMLVGNFGTDSTPIWKIVGIYWGGASSDGSDFYPFFSIFNSSWKNYLSQWD